MAANSTVLVLHDEHGESTLRVRPLASSTRSQEVERIAGERGRLLIIDDDPTACEVLAMALGRHHDVTWRTSADDALGLIGQADFDVLLTDLNMSGLGGLNLCERIVAMRPDIPVVVVTGHGTLETAVAAI